MANSRARDTQLVRSYSKTNMALFEMKKRKQNLQYQNETQNKLPEQRNEKILTYHSKLLAKKNYSRVFANHPTRQNDISFNAAEDNTNVRFALRFLSLSFIFYRDNRVMATFHDLSISLSLALS